MEKFKDEMLPIQYSGWDAAGDYGDIIFYDTTFLEDFGEIKKGEYFSSIALLMNKGIIEFYKNSEDSDPIINMKVTIQPFVSYDEKYKNTLEFVKEHENENPISGNKIGTIDISFVEELIKNLIK